MYTSLKHGEKYTDLMSTIHVLDLNQIQLASAEDRQWKLDYWAKIFKAATCEELKMLATDNEYFAETTNSLYELSQDHYIRQRCLDLQVYYDNMNELAKLREESK